MNNPHNDSFGAALASFAIKKPITTFMIFLSLLLLGAISSRLLPLEKFPGIDIPELYINVPYPNATPAEVERLITRPIEEVIATISGIKSLNSESTENGADIGIEFEWDENINAKSVEIREKVDSIRHLLPDDVQRVLIYQFNTNDMPIFQLRISSEQDLSLAYDLLEKNLKRPLERVTGVSKVELYGVDKRQISIRLDSAKVVALHIDTAKLTQQLSKYNFSIAAGYFYDNNQKYLLSPSGEFTSIDDINNIVVAPNIKLKDIATITYELPIPFEGRHLNQTYAIGMNILKESSANLVEVADKVLAVIDEVKANPQFTGINLYVMENTAKGVTGSLSDLLNAGLIGALLSVIVLYLFLRQFTITLIVVLSVPISICITLGMMYLFGYTLNILSMMGLLLAVGMLVDNSVVITESIMQERTKTTDLIQSTKNGVNKVSMAVIAGTATTMIVFLPNIVGQKIDVTIFLEHVAIAICISLAASLIIAQTLIPLLLTKLKNSRADSSSTAAEVKVPRYHKAYLTSLKWSYHHPKTSGFIALLLLLSIAIPMQFVTGNEHNNFDDNRIFLRYHTSEQFKLEEAEKIVNKMENYLFANKEAFYIDSVYSYYNSRDISTTILLKDEELPISKKDLIENIRKDMPTFVRAKPTFGFNQGSSGGVRVNISGLSTDVLINIADNIIPILSRVDGLVDVATQVKNTSQEVQIKVDRLAAYRFGLSTSEIANAVSTALRGRNLRTFRHADTGEVDIRLTMDEKIQSSIDELKNLPILQTSDSLVTLAHVAELKIVPLLNRISRSDRQTSLVIQANLKDITLDEARERITNTLDKVNFPTGYKYSLKGSFERQDEGQQVMITNMLLAVCMIYIVMAALFESLLLPTAVITSLLYSFVGVFWAFMITGNSMSVMGMIGMLILMGIVVNNGIVLVDRINQLVNQGLELKDAVFSACDSRLRPILMTVATTVLGLVPLAMGDTSIGGDGPAYSPMAIAIIGGLIFSTITSLYLVPFAYVQLLAMRRYFANIFTSAKRIVPIKQR